MGEPVTITERLHQDAYSSLDRALRADGGRVLVKSWNPGGGARFARRERRLWADLEAAGLARVLAVEGPGADGACRVVLEDPGGVPLRTFWRTHPLSLDDVLALARALAELVEGLHALGIVHLDLRPEHFLVEPRELAVHLVDARHAYRLGGSAPGGAPTPGQAATRVRASSAAAEEEEAGEVGPIDPGGLPYRAPELFLDRRPDPRTDLYALGVVVYEALSGRPPFAAGDLEGWRHAHLARRPPRPRHRGQEVPDDVWDVLARLLAKEPAERPASAAVLKGAWQACRERLGAHAGDAGEAAAAGGQTATLHLRDEVYGRDRERRRLSAAARRAAAGRAQLVLVSGPAGIGKTSFVRDALRRLRAEGAEVLEDFPASLGDRRGAAGPLIGPFRTFARRKLGAPEDDGRRWRDRVRSLVGADLAVLLPALPALQRVADASPRAEALAPAAQRRRFLSALSRLAAACCAEDGVTVLFYDDVQDWDASTLDAAVHVFSTLRDRRLVVVCAVREEGRGAPASVRLQAALRATGADLDHLRLPPLQEADGLRLVAAALGLEADQATPLAEVLFRRSGGNPLFFRHLLMAVYERGLLRYDARLREWRWDLAAVRNMPIPDRLAPFLAEFLRRLSGETRSTLAWAACIGPVFDVATLAEARGQPVEAM